MIVSSHFNRALQSSSRFNFSGKKRIHPVLSPRWPSDYAMRGGGREEPRIYTRGRERHSFDSRRRPWLTDPF